MSTVENRPPLRGIHDLKFAVSDLDESLRFYERAARQAMFDPLAIIVDDRAALERWDAALTQLGVLHSPIVKDRSAQDDSCDQRL
jgi:hypothetical protein